MHGDNMTLVCDPSKYLLRLAKTSPPSCYETHVWSNKSEPHTHRSRTAKNGNRSCWRRLIMVGGNAVGICGGAAPIKIMASGVRIHTQGGAVLVTMGLGVLPEGAWMGVGFAAGLHRARVLLVGGVCVHVLLAVGAVGETTLAALVFTLKGLLSWKTSRCCW